MEQETTATVEWNGRQNGTGNNCNSRMKREITRTDDGYKQNGTGNRMEQEATATAEWNGKQNEAGNNYKKQMTITNARNLIG